ncbi:654_t:CDS:2 [Funneliformis caledonium]|uniref:654_t:CDS:1 n=1 Tax=Funneliformis caledonium TaxID=1117310 RepID=A0A9N9CDM3_9GLOM|nr:654_t:CDS:2 [Funneliformis caledonium]
MEEILGHKTVASLDIVSLRTNGQDPGGNVVDELIGMAASSQEGLLTGCKISGKLKVLRGHGSGRERSSLFPMFLSDGRPTMEE